jgi:hypothetical protein
MSDLELVATDDLRKELLRRFDYAIFVGVQEGQQDKPHTDYRIHRFKHGNVHACIGLAIETHQFWIDELQSSLVDEDEE